MNHEENYRVELTIYDPFNKESHEVDLCPVSVLLNSPTLSTVLLRLILELGRQGLSCSVREWEGGLHD